MSSAALAAVLNELAGEIEHLGSALCSDPAFVARHGTALQAIDLIAQTQRALAATLAAPCQPCAADAVSLGTLRARLVAVLGACDGECAPDHADIPGPTVTRT